MQECSNTHAGGPAEQSLAPITHSLTKSCPPSARSSFSDIAVISTPTVSVPTFPYTHLCLYQDPQAVDCNPTPLNRSQVNPHDTSQSPLGTLNIPGSNLSATSDTWAPFAVGIACNLTSPPHDIT